MAVVTVGSKISIVNIIPVMTIYATTGALVIFLKRLEVAAIAMQFLMRPLDLEIGHIVIKSPDQPIVWVMALRTILAQCLLMNVILLMAIITA